MPHANDAVRAWRFLILSLGGNPNMSFQYRSHGRSKLRDGVRACGTTLGALIALGLLSGCSSNAAQPESGVATGKSSVVAASTAESLCNNDPRVWDGLVSLNVCVGARLFFDETFGGNGRTCG